MEWVKDGRGRVDETFDRAVLAAIERGEGEAFAAHSTGWIEEHGGNGGQEVRNWLAAAATAGDAGGRLLFYEPLPRWLTGVALYDFAIA